MSDSLRGKSVLVLRPSDRLEEAETLLRAKGASPLSVPAIAIGPPPDPPSLRAELTSLDRYDWVMFTSPSGVRAAFDEGADAAMLNEISVAAIGPGTAASLAEYGVRTDWMPERYTTSAAAETFPVEGGPRILLLRADVATPDMEKTLTGRGAQVTRIDTYTTTAASAEELLDALRTEPDAILITSGSIAASLAAASAEDRHLVSRAVIACIGPASAGVCRDLGLRVDVEAQSHTIAGLVAALEEHFSGAK